MTAFTIDALHFLPEEYRRAVVLTGPRVAAESPFDVTALAVAAVSSALTAVRDLSGSGDADGAARLVRVDAGAAVASFRADALFQPHGWALPSPWDELSGAYRGADGWIRLHTNYAHHRAAVEAVLGVSDRASVERAVAGWPVRALEDAVVAAGGAAAAMLTESEWAARGPAPAPLPVRTERDGVARPAPTGAAALPLTGVRVLDLTRVIAGPVATRILGAYGADVLRIDPPGFEEVAALMPETTRTKRRSALDLTTPRDRAIFDDLVANADVVVCGLRAGSRALDDERAVRMNPGLILARLTAYDWRSPWRGRRGFDSLVQFSTGIAHATADSSGTPGALPMQALDHATGWLLAGEIVRAIGERRRSGRPSTLHASLAATAGLLTSLPGAPEPAAVVPASFEDRETAWGPALGVIEPGTVDGIVARAGEPAGLLGVHEPVWLPR